MVQLDADLAGRWVLTLVPAVAQARVRSGRVAYDAADMIAGVGSLTVPFVRATVAMERAGLASDDEAIQAREQRPYIPTLIRAWLAAEPMPRERVRATARRAAGLVASSILRRASGLVCGADGALDGWPLSHCPCCGGSPDFGVCGGGDRTLICARCDTRWPTAARGCLGCGEREPPVVARIRSDALGCELVICNACGRYLKELVDDGPLEPIVERVLTGQLDAAAEARGLRL